MQRCKIACDKIMTKYNSEETFESDLKRVRKKSNEGCNTSDDVNNVTVNERIT